jgi:hypothetical protein
MRRSMKSLLSGLAAATVALLATGAAEAKCTRLGFSVNDYGKEGPIKDAKALLDTYIAKWAAENGIKKYTTGKKDVSCELFIDLIVFDEHTCKAEATVCWGDSTAPAAKDAAAPAAKAAPATKPAAPAPAKAKSAEAK